MLPIIVGTDRESGRGVSLDPDLFRTHLHLLGATGSGKTVCIHTLLRPLLGTNRPKCCLFLIDPMGNLTQDLLKWFASERLCPSHVRDRLVYIEPSREDVVLPFNPLLHDSDDHLYYQVGRAVEITLRAWASQNLEEMPRLRQWCFNSFFAVAAMGLPLATAQYLLHPGSVEHEAILKRIPARLKLVWSEILAARGSERVRILESTRNRLAPFFDSGILRRMFSSTETRFDVERFIRERKIVIVNVAGYGRLDKHIGKTIGALFVNEIIQRAMNLPPTVVDPTYLLLDEFQNFVGPDLYDALPIVRQVGLRLILAHQSFSQLERGDVDLSGLIWQARSRLMFANDAEDADLIAHELATLSYDPMKLKEEMKSLRQRIVGHRKEWLKNYGKTATTSDATDVTSSESTARRTGQSRGPDVLKPTRSEGDQSSSTHGHSEKHATSDGTSVGQSETLVPIHEDFYEVSSRTYFSFEEHRTIWA
ncbi:MAG: type IV secretory system conjugative DNA transfer family protein, partial [Planctomycetaceae bacterium]|nr:type IV secretory system conjugative DNA transfer family protein [Planctomycetaceae bacterium]